MTRFTRANNISGLNRSWIYNLNTEQRVITLYTFQLHFSYEKYPLDKSAVSSSYEFVKYFYSFWTHRCRNDLNFVSANLI